MHSSRVLAFFCALSVVACSAQTSSPASPSVASPRAFADSDGPVGSTAVTATRMRLRIVGGGDIMTGLQTGQSIDVPLNQKLDVWAEIQRLESDRARLVVDWGNGNYDFSGCGACRLENTYTRTGTHTLTARVLDLNDTTGTPVASATVTINVVDTSSPCSGPPVSETFEGFEIGAPTPLNGSGVAFSDPSGGYIWDYTPLFTPYLVTRFLYFKRPSGVITFANDRNEFRAGFGAGFGATLTYAARDVAGNVVKSGTIPTGASGEGVGGFLSFSGVVFRSLEISVSEGSDFGVDNLTAACR